MLSFLSFRILSRYVLEVYEAHVSSSPRGFGGCSRLLKSIMVVIAAGLISKRSFFGLSGDTEEVGFIVYTGGAYLAVKLLAGLGFAIIQAC
jgi:hypothetical protein